jgi:hypothetical protein
LPPPQGPRTEASPPPPVPGTLGSPSSGAFLLDPPAAPGVHAEGPKALPFKAPGDEPRAAPTPAGTLETPVASASAKRGEAAVHLPPPAVSLPSTRPSASGANETAKPAPSATAPAATPDLGALDLTDPK